MTFDELIDRSSLTPNVDIDCFLSDDTFPAPDLAVTIDAGGAIRLVDSGGGYAPIGGGTPYLGQTRNTPPPGSPSVNRIAGFARCVFGAAVAVGNRLRPSHTTGRMIPFDPDNGDGHDHLVTVLPVRHLIFVSKDGASPWTGLVDSDFEKTLQWDNGGAFAAASETVTVTEVSAGEYLVEYTPGTPVMYRLRLRGQAGGAGAIVWPPEFQEVAPKSYGSINAAALTLIAGFALTAGGDGDAGVMYVERQLL